MAAKRKYSLHQKSQNLQCSFNLQINILSQSKLGILLNKFKSEYDCDEYDHQEEKKRYYNLMTYLHYCLQNIEEAKQCNEMALKIDPESIVALGNKAWILFQEHGNAEDSKSIDQILQRIDVLFTDRVKLAEAKSEEAYTYARFGLLYYERAEYIYEHVLNDLICSDKLPVFLWQYGCGLIKNRLLRRNCGYDDTRYKNTIKRVASLFSQVANQDDNIRYKARAYAELGNLANSSRKDVDVGGSIGDPNEMFSKAIKLLHDNDILDIPVLEQYAIYCNMQHQTHLSKQTLLETIKIRESPRALTLLSRILYNQLKKEQKVYPIPDNNESQEILHLYDSAIAKDDISARGYKGKILMEMGKYKQAIDEFEKVYKLLKLLDPQQIELEWETNVLCETCHAKCLYLSSNDAESIKQAKILLWSAIELSFDARMESREQNNQLKHPVYAMLKLLSQGPKTPESIREEIIMCELVGNTDRADKLRREIQKKGMSLAQPSDMAKRLIKLHQFNEGIFLLNQMMVSNTLPEELKEFAIEANIDGAEYALRKGNAILASRRVLSAFNIRFQNDNSYHSQEQLHIYLCANEHNQNLAHSMQESITNYSTLNITTSFDAMPGRLQFSDIEESMLQSSVLVILLDDNDMKNDDVGSRVFQISVEMAHFMHIKYKKEKSLIVITVSDQCVIPDRLSYVPYLPLDNLFQEDNIKWMHTFLQRALLTQSFSN
ncbi:hypothetical protein ACJMK2_031966 [Sinanodonta woodiana]|uniref:Uncharacterized protein n=1 Tax=Sinanodonta woodiana TaxID=1069815 RepID=A0ABD3WZY6_SINWO